MILCAGQALIDCIVTESGSENVADDIALCPGGEAFNAAVTLAKLGEDAVLLAAVGKDPAGGLLRDQLTAAGVGLLTENYPGRTPVALLTVNAGGGRKSRVSQVHRLAGFVPRFPAGLKPDWAVLGSLFRPPFLDAEAAAGFARAAKAAGAKLLADTKLPKGTQPRLEDYRNTLALLDVITPNEEEAVYYTGCSRPEQAAAVFHRFGVRTVIVKLAERGCFVSCPEGAFSCPAFSVPVADGIGAGDCFTAGLLSALRRGFCLAAAVRFAAACAAISVTERGATAALRDRAQVEAFLHSRCPN